MQMTGKKNAKNSIILKRDKRHLSHFQINQWRFQLFTIISIKINN
jgi:hypothetical protein